jgi:hypothetical protein
MILGPTKIKHRLSQIRVRVYFGQRGINESWTCQWGGPTPTFLGLHRKRERERERERDF